MRERKGDENAYNFFADLDRLELTYVT